jgi:hypothetical protein
VIHKDPKQISKAQNDRFRYVGRLQTVLSGSVTATCQREINSEGREEQARVAPLRALSLFSRFGIMKLNWLLRVFSGSPPHHPGVLALYPGNRSFPVSSVSSVPTRTCAMQDNRTNVAFLLNCQKFVEYIKVRTSFSNLVPEHFPQRFPWSIEQFK